MIFKGPQVNIKRLLYTNVGRSIISVVFGLGIAALFYKACDEKNCITFRGPNINELDGRIIQHGENCYTNQVVTSSCDDSKQKLEISKEAPSIHPANGNNLSSIASSSWSLWNAGGSTVPSDVTNTVPPTTPPLPAH